MRLLFFPLRKHGAFLTLGITFVSLLLLVFVSILLKHAETSEQRLAEFASFDRIATLDTSIQRAYREGFLTIFAMNISSNTSSLYIIQPLARTLTTEIDQRFTHFQTFSIISSQYLATRNTLFNFSSSTLYPLLNHTFLFGKPFNFSYGYLAIDSAADVDLSTLPAYPVSLSQESNAVLLVINQSLDLRIRLTHAFHPAPLSPNPDGEGLVSWDLNQGTDGPQITLTVESSFPNFNSTITDSVFTQTITGEAAHRIFFNYTIAARPIIEIGNFFGGPFDMQTGILIAPFDNDVLLEIEASSPGLTIPPQLYSYDNFNFSIPDTPISKTSNPRIF